MVAPLSRAGRGLKPAYSLASRARPLVAPLSRAGRGLKQYLICGQLFPKWSPRSHERGAD